MAALMGEGEHVAQHVFLVVHEDVGIAHERAGGERAGALALVLVAVHPAATQPRSQGGAVVVAERGEGCDHHLHRVVVAVPYAHVAGQRHVDVVVAQFVEREDTLAQRVIGVQLRQVVVHGGDQIVVHRGVHAVREQRRLARRRVASHPGAVDVQLHAAAVKGCEGVLVLLEVAVELQVGAPPQVAVGMDHELRPGRLAERHRSVRRIHGAEVEVDVGQRRERLARRLVGLDLQRQQPLLLRGEDVRLEAQQLAQRDGELGQRFVGQELLDDGVRDRLDLGGDVALLGLGAAGDVEVARGAALVVAVAGVFAGAQHRVVADPFVEHLQFVEKLQAGAQVGRRFGERAFEGGDARQHSLVILDALFPGVLGREQLGEVPLVGGGNLTAFGNGRCVFGHGDQETSTQELWSEAA